MTQPTIQQANHGGHQPPLDHCDCTKLMATVLGSTLKKTKVASAQFRMEEKNGPKLICRQDLEFVLSLFLTNKQRKCFFFFDSYTIRLFSHLHLGIDAKINK